MSLSALCILLYFKFLVIFSAMEVSLLYKSDFPSSTWCIVHHSWGTEEFLRELPLSKCDPLKEAHLLKSLLCSFSMIGYSVLIVGLQAELAHPRQLWIHLYKWSNLWSHLMKRLLRIIQCNENATLYIIQNLLYDQAIILLQTLQVISKKLPLPHIHKILFKDLLKIFFFFIKIRVGDVLLAFTWMTQRWIGKWLKRSTLSFYLAHTQKNF